MVTIHTRSQSSVSLRNEIYPSIVPFIHSFIGFGVVFFSLCNPLARSGVIHSTVKDLACHAISGTANGLGRIGKIVNQEWPFFTITLTEFIQLKWLNPHPHLIAALNDQLVGNRTVFYGHRRETTSRETVTLLSLTMGCFAWPYATGTERTTRKHLALLSTAWSVCRPNHKVYFQQRAKVNRRDPHINRSRSVQHIRFHRPLTRIYNDEKAKFLITLYMFSLQSSHRRLMTQLMYSGIFCRPAPRRMVLTAKIDLLLLSYAFYVFMYSDVVVLFQAANGVYHYG